jgi:hypothetical protein
MEYEIADCLLSAVSKKQLCVLGHAKFDWHAKEDEQLQYK